MKILFIGGTGYISTACTKLAVASGFDVTLLNRSTHAPIAGAKTLTADISNQAAASAALAGNTWDSVVDFIAFTPRRHRVAARPLPRQGRPVHLHQRASAYQKPLTDYLVTESTPLANPIWDYSRNKIVCGRAPDARVPRGAIPDDSDPPLADLRRLHHPAWR